MSTSDHLDGLEAFRDAGRMLRGNLHTHSTQSDGHQPAAQVATAYRAAGYDFLVLSDHFEANYGWQLTDPAELSDERFTLIRGAELSSDPALAAANSYWVSAVGLPEDFAPPPPDDHEETVRRAHDLGAYNVLLHPKFNWDPWEPEPWASNTAHLDAVEVYNFGMARYAPDRATAHDVVERLWASGRRVQVNAGDDSHGTLPRDRFGGWIMVRAKDASPEAIVDALKRGAHYATQGPRIDDLRLEDDQLHVRCTPVDAIVLTGAQRWVPERQRFGSDMTSASFALDAPRSPYVRVTLVDHMGLRAWSNPIWLR